MCAFEKVDLTPTHATNGVGCSKELFGGRRPLTRAGARTKRRLGIEPARAEAGG